MSEKLISELHSPFNVYQDLFITENEEDLEPVLELRKLTIEEDKFLNKISNPQTKVDNLLSILKIKKRDLFSDLNSKTEIAEKVSEDLVVEKNVNEIFWRLKNYCGGYYHENYGLFNKLQLYDFIKFFHSDYSPMF
jgi:hypothetical protein